jgi:hypothetical protein
MTLKIVRKWKRRRPGIYLVRTRKHLHPWRRENGYVGESVDVVAREKDHRGTGRYGHKAKCWSDLEPTWHVLRLPWWLGWKWLLRPLETLAILLLAPRYNEAKNRWNPRRVSIYSQQAQRRARDTGGLAYRAGVQVAVFGRRTVQFLGVLLILMGVAMTVKDQM